MIALLCSLLYPLEHPPQVTSTFGAYRLTHHHAGLDLGSDGDERVVVRAAAAGRVYRIRRSQNGYGRAVYVRHEDGRVTVYGHLSAFAPKLAAVVRAAETRVGGYRIERRPNLPVARGEALGWIGTAGTDLVHLHFELRDGDPINPLTHGLDLPDTQSPRFVALLARPRAPDAHVAGAFDDAVLPFVDGALAAPVVAGGDFVLLVDVRDRIDGSPRDLRPYELELRVDGALRHHSRYARVSYADKHHIELDADPGRRASEGRVFHRLYRAGPPLRVHRRSRRHFRDLRAGDHPAELIARDAAGNTARATFTLRIAPREPPCEVARARLEGAAVEARRVWRAGVLAVALPGLCTDPRLDVRVGGRRARPIITRLGSDPAVALRVPTEGASRVRVAWAGGALSLRTHAVADEVTLRSGALVAEVEEEARFGAYATEILERPAAPPAGLEPVSPLHRFADGWQPARGITAVGLRPPKGTNLDGVALYLEDGGEWWRLGGARRDGRLWGSSLHLTGFALLRDTAAPVIGTPSVEAHPAGARIVVPIVERDVAAHELWIDGERVHPEWQRAWGRLLYRPWTPLAPGPHALRVRIADRAGWTAEAELQLNWPASAPPVERSR